MIFRGVEIANFQIFNRISLGRVGKRGNSVGVCTGGLVVVSMMGGKLGRVVHGLVEQF